MRHPDRLAAGRLEMYREAVAAHVERSGMDLLDVAAVAEQAHLAF